MQRTWSPFQRLQWKLTLSYTLTTIVTIVLIELLTCIVLLTYILFNQVALLENSVQTQATQLIPYFVHGTPDREALAKWLQISNAGLPASSVKANNPGFLAVIDTHGQVLASRGASAPAVNTPVQDELSASASTDLTVLLRGHSHTTHLSDQTNAGVLVLLAQIQEQGGPILGALVIQTHALNGADLFVNYRNLLGLVGINVVLLAILAGLAGTLFGALTARGFTRRFKQLSQAADNWSSGDFSTIVHDSSGDELGQLSRRLNRMAEELQTLLETRQQLATLEERNRLARDLHDSVKQQVFSLAMQVGALKVLLRRDVDAAERRLGEIERMVRMAQKELSSLIHELRPVALEGKNLASALHDFAQQWANQTWISAHVQVEGDRDLLPQIEEALFRIIQEALSNVARHSNASSVQIQLRNEEKGVSLIISDNGQGFNVSRALGRGVGLLSIRERIQVLGGNVRVESTNGKGTAIHVYCATQQIRKKEV